MKILESIIKAYFVLDERKRFTSKALSDLGLWYDGTDYNVENLHLFEQKVWTFLSDQQKLDLLLEQQTQHNSEISELKNSVKRLEDRLDNLRISTQIVSKCDYDY